MEKKTVVVTGIGGNVGQGIVRNLRLTGLPLRIIGTNVTDFSGGNHLVDEFYKVPYAFDPDFLPAMQAIVNQTNADLVVPSTDFEVYYLGKMQDSLGCLLATSGENAAGIYLDKYLTWEHHQKFGIPFATSYLPSSYSGQFKNAIAKPRKGRGSRGLMKNNFDPKMLSDEEYMVQELFEGKEITTAVYRSYITNQITGLLTMERSLENGATNYCRVVYPFDTQLLAMAERMSECSDLKGSFNIQSIVTASGEIVPFEVNCRISGTNSIRSHFGFKDVEYTVRELLYHEPAPKPEIRSGVAQRILLDVIYPDVQDETELEKNATDSFIIF